MKGCDIVTTGPTLIFVHVLFHVLLHKYASKTVISCNATMHCWPNWDIKRHFGLKKKAQYIRTLKHCTLWGKLSKSTKSQEKPHKCHFQIQFGTVRLVTTKRHFIHGFHMSWNIIHHNPRSWFLIWVVLPKGAKCFSKCQFIFTEECINYHFASTKGVNQNI